MPHFFAAATAAAGRDDRRGGEKMLVSCRELVHTTEGALMET
jgi:hypothetical protein